MSKYQVNNHSVLKVSNDEAKEGSSWHDIARARASKQHPSGELSDDDIHAVKKHPDHFLPQTNSPETEEALHTLEDQIKALQAKEQEKARMRAEQLHHQPQHNPHHQLFGDDAYDDLYKE